MNRQLEGWLGEEYVRVYATSDRSRIAQLYEFSTYLPSYEPWGSWGLDALCLGPDSRLYVIDWIPLDEEYRKERYKSVEEFETGISQLREAPSDYEHFKKEIHYTHPLVLGGDPDIAPIMLDQETHADACRYFNQLCRSLKAKAT